MDKEEKSAIIEQFRIHEKDTGSAEVQVALLTNRIKQLTEHLRQHRHDYHCQRGLIALVGRRRKMLVHLSKEDPQCCESLVTRLGLRRLKQ